VSDPVPVPAGPDLAELRRLAEAATPGPWAWSGSVKYGMYLAHWRPGWGQCTVMDFVRHGMSGAQPRFADERSHMGHKAVDIAVREVPYRDDVVALDHPDARWLAAASPDVVLALLDRIEALEAAAEEQTVACGHEWTTSEPQECNRPAHQDGHHGPGCHATIGHTCAFTEGHRTGHVCGFCGESERCPAVETEQWRCTLPADHGDGFHYFAYVDAGAAGPAGDPETTP